jgi:hypothetical protein
LRYYICIVGVCLEVFQYVTTLVYWRFENGATTLELKSGKVDFLNQKQERADDNLKHSIQRGLWRL